MKNLLIAIFTTLLICSCNSKKEISNPGDTNLLNQAYPLKIGNSWTYHYYGLFYELTDSTLEPVSVTDTIYSYISSLETILDSVKAYSLVESSFSDSFSFRKYYNNTDKGLLYFAYQSGGSPIVLKGAKPSMLASQLLLSEYLTSNDTLYYNYPPRIVLKYPITINDSWVYLDDGTFYITKKVIADTILSLPIGNIYCYKIRWSFNINPSMIVDQYISPDYGLVKALQYSFSEVRNDTGGVVDTLNSITEYYLIDCHLN